ncbi:hypothetical protein [Motilibacter aurantiacus]|uniref:hypothetical protein n=1 Tax=Motilibacter aurantiacus TaxID=2714955 RepID=UPI00140D1243|nr:hypothetical protein [Motilibacter aurantiacus]NHC44034.1 hypothetical protein [Motilibacter aurantiacus]
MRVQVESLQDYASELETEIAALERAPQRLNGNAAFGGGFGEAIGLRDRHDLVLQQMRDLLQQVRAGIATAQAAAQQIAARYEGADELSRVRLEEITSTMGTPAPTTTGL